MRILIATLKSWNIQNAENFKKEYLNKHDVKIITQKEELTYENVTAFLPDYIFFPHWSYIIPESIFREWECIVFHMTDLPFGRGGSPLQNLIVLGCKSTKISAIKVVKDIDAGPVYLKHFLSLKGSADSILKRASKIVYKKMIPEIINKKILPKPQTGEVTLFKRRKPEESRLLENMDLNMLYDNIRMLDGEGYPYAFIEFGNYYIEFYNAIKDKNMIKARVRIRERG